MKRPNYSKLIILLLMALISGSGWMMDISATTGTKQDDVDGSIRSKGFNNRLLIDRFELFETQTQTPSAVQSGRNLQPTYKYRLELDITDFDTLDDINAIEFRFFAGGGFDLSTVNSCLDTSLTSGTALNPHQICTWDDLDQVRNHLDAHFVLMNSLSPDVPGYANLASASANSNQGWLPIEDFTGSFDGQGWVINGLNINASSKNVGLFGSLLDAEIKDLFITDAIITTSGFNAGILVGKAEGTTSIENVHVVGQITALHSVGGLVGALSNINGSIDLSSSDALVIATESTFDGTKGAGGLVGVNYGSIDRSTSEGEVQKDSVAGGLVGATLSGSSITRSYSEANVSGNLIIGGLIGHADGNVSITNNYSSGDIIASEIAGGFVGRATVSVTFTNNHSQSNLVNIGLTMGGFSGENLNATYLNNYWNIDTSNIPLLSQAVGNGTTTGITGLDAMQMQTFSSFQGWSISQALNSNIVWLSSGAFPILMWKAGFSNEAPALIAAPLLTTFEEALYTSNLGNQFVFRWERNTNAALHMGDFEMVVNSGSGPLLNDGSGRRFAGLTTSGITWEVIQSTAPAFSSTETGMKIEVEFRVSKVARMAIDPKVWQFGVLIEDGLFAEASGAPSTSLTQVKGLQLGNAPVNAPHSVFGMEWYGEVSIATGSSISWQNLRAGSQFSDTSNESILENVTFFSNGEYQRDIISDAQWLMNPDDALPDGSTPPAILSDLDDVFTSLQGQVFGLRVSEGISESDLSQGAVKIEALVKRIDFSLQQTNEEGFVSDYFFFIALSQNFQNAAYSGKLNFQVSNYLPGN